jgi:hypothetical protein
MINGIREDIRLAPPPEMRYWLNWSELTRSSEMTLETFRDHLRRFPRSALLIACARTSIIFDFGPDANTLASQEKTEYWVQHLFHPQLVSRALAFARQGRPIFFQGQVRFLAAEVMRVDPAPPEDGSQVPDWAYGELLLAAGELLQRGPMPAPENDLEKMADIVASFLPTFEIDCLTDPFILFLRTYIYLTVIIPRLPANKRTFDPNVEFEKIFGFPLDLYIEFLYAFTIHAMNERVNMKLGDVPEAGLPVSWFKTTVLTENQISLMFDSVCCRLIDLPDKRTVHGFADFTVLKDHPYLRVEDKIYALDYEYASAKLENGLYWRVADAMEERRRLGYFGFWGDVFEEYVNWLFEVYPDKSKNHCYPEPRYLLDRDNRPICDVIVMCGSTAVLIEAKVATLRIDVRYAGDGKKMGKELDKKLVYGTDRPVGVSQLMNAINNILEKPKEELPKWLRDVRKIIPVVITRDDIGSSWMTNGYLNTRFQEMKGGRRYKKTKVTPLVSMSIGSLERACSALQQMEFSDLMEDRIREDRNLGRPFEAASTWVPRGTPGRVHRHVEIMKELAEKMRVDFGIKEE